MRTISTSGRYKPALSRDTIFYTDSVFNYMIIRNSGWKTCRPRLEVCTLGLGAPQLFPYLTNYCTRNKSKENNNNIKKKR